MLDNLKGFYSYARAVIVRTYREINQHIQDRRRDRAIALLFYSRGESEVALNSLIKHALGRRATPVRVIDLGKELAGHGQPDYVEMRIVEIQKCPK